MTTLKLFVNPLKIAVLVNLLFYVFCLIEILRKRALVQSNWSLNMEGSIFFSLLAVRMSLISDCHQEEDCCKTLTGIPEACFKHQIKWKQYSVALLWFQIPNFFGLFWGLQVLSRGLLPCLSPPFPSQQLKMHIKIC